MVLLALKACLALAPAGYAALHRIDAGTPAGLRELFQPGPTPLPFVSAHRGGAKKGFPENCLATFEHTLQHTFAILEIDPRYTKDSAIVVHHDATLDRTTTGTGKVTDFTLAELKQLRLKDTEGRATEFPMPTLDEAIAWARGKTVLVLDQKDVSAVDRARIITRHKAEAWVMLIVSSFKDVQAVHALNPEIMMEVMIPTRAKAEEFSTLGMPWRNAVAFVGHVPPEDVALYDYIHRQGASCMIGTSRNLDRKILTGAVTDLKMLEPDYRAFQQRGADIIETDIPVLLGPLLNGAAEIPATKKKYLHAK